MNAEEHVKHLSFEEWVSIFDLLKTKPNAVKEDVLKLSVFKHRKRSNKTINRALNVSRELFRRGEEPLTDAEAEVIAQKAKYETSQSFVTRADLTYQNWKNRPNDTLKVSPDQNLICLHLDNLKSQIKSLRLCLEHPGTELAIDRGLLTFRGHDWRLDPIRWFCLSTPDIESDDWKPHLEQLRSHTAGWAFWSHWEEIKNASMALAYEMKRIGREIAEQDADFKVAWNKATSDMFYYRHGAYFRPSRTALTPDPSASDIIQTLDDDTIEYLISEIEKHHPEPLWEKQAELEEMLEQLTIDFSDNRLDEWIVKGHCEGCPK